MAIFNALTIAGSDSGGGAGIQADLKSFSAMGVYGASVITALTAQNTRKVAHVEYASLKSIAAQIKAVLEDINVSAIKIGMLGNADIIETVAAALKGYRGPIVLDPVMVAKSGDVLLAENATRALKQHLFSRSAILTPNLPEAAQLLGVETARNDAQMQAQGQELLNMGAGAILMKGGHGAGADCTDWLIDANGAQCFLAPRIKTHNTHGTGCSMSAAIAAGLAKGESAVQAVATAHQWLHGAIGQADTLSVGTGHGPVHHFHALWRKA